MRDFHATSLDRPRLEPERLVLNVHRFETRLIGQY